MEVNKYQSIIDLTQYPEEVAEQFEDCINNIPYIKNLISKDRKYARDLPRDDKGRIIVDITNPHILEDMDYFRQPAIHFEKHKCYTFLRPSANPQSEYYKYWQEEIRRCREGYVRESDGEWITGYCYWFMNYNPMMVNKVIKGSKRALRTEAFPYMWEGIYLRFHYIQQARDAGLNWIELAKRSVAKAHTYDQVVYTPNGVKLWGDIQVGDMLFDAHGGTTKVVDIPFNGYAECYKITLRDGREITASDDHLWKVKIHCHKNIELHTTKELLSIYKRKRKVSEHSKGIEYIVSILSNDGCDYEYHKTQVDPYTMGLLLGDGCFRHSCPGYYTQLDEDFEIERKYIPYEITKWSDKYAHCIKVPNLKNILRDYGLFMAKSEDKFIPDEYKYNSVEVRKELLYGLIDTDGHVGRKNKYRFSTASEKLRDDIIWICRSLGYNASYSIKKAGYKKDGTYIECLPCYSVTIHTTESLSRLPRKQLVENNGGLYRSRIDGTRIVNIESIGMQPCKCVTVDADDHQYLVGDFVATHNSYSLSAIMTHNLFLGENAESNKRIITVLAAAHKDFLSDSKDGTLSKFRPAINFIMSNTPLPNLFLKNSPNEMVWQMGYKNTNGVESGSMNTVMAISLKDDSEKLRGKRGFILYEEMGSMPNLLTAYDIAQRSVYEGDYAFGQQGMLGTAAESESDFSSAKTLLYAPRSYKIKDNPNVYDRVGQGKEHFGYFFPAYLNRAGCYNEDGVSDVTKALMEVLMNRYEAKYGANTKSVLRIIAEDPITPAEAIIKVKAAFFPVQDCNSRLTMLEDEHAFDDVAVGVIDLKGDKVSFRPTSDVPIHTFPVSNDTPGAIEFYQMPEIDKKTDKAYSNRYIIGVDPVNSDAAESSSLYSTFVFDLWTDNIVAEFTGRKQFADDNFEITRRLSLYYNAMVCYEANLKGIFAYFQKMNSTHLLAETPQYLRDRGMVKYTAFGSNAYGINANAVINNYANQLIRDWLLKPYEDIVEGDIVVRPNVYRIKAKALLEELVAFTPEINVDRIRALGMVMLLREQELINCGGDISVIKAGNRHENYLGDDPFFSKFKRINTNY